jgi:serine phosphatase RsbU (regulator of sigma subunit)
MIEMGTMLIQDRAAVAAARVKVHGLVRAIHGSEIVAIRAATAVSECARRMLLRGGGSIELGIVADGRDVALRFRFAGHLNSVDEQTLPLFFSRICVSDSCVQADLPLPMAAVNLDAGVIERERGRIASKSRSELMGELREKNRQLEAYSESLEATVAERTAELRIANEKMQQDLDAGAEYVRGLIPPPITGPVSVSWRYVPSSNLGGDTIGYHWLDAEHLSMYLIDVTGHGLDSALLAVSVTNIIRSGTLPGVDMRRPESVITALNETFQSDHHGNKFFTIWYGVYQPRTRRISWSSGGHHPAVLLSPRSPRRLLPASGPLIGCGPGLEFPEDSCEVEAGSRLLLFSDGVFELIRDNKLVWDLDGVVEFLSERADHGGDLMDVLLEHARLLRGDSQLDDDFSVIEMRFD